MNLWHDVSPGENYPDELNTVIEIPRGSKNKFEIDKETGMIALDRVTYTTQDFPFDYGFVPQTLWDDGDALDVILLTTHPLFPGILARVRPVGLMHMRDDGDRDDKIIAVPVDDPRWTSVKDITDVNPHTLEEMKHFYSTYKNLQNKEVVVNGFKGRAEAAEALVRARGMYRTKFKA